MTGCGGDTWTWTWTWTWEGDDVLDREVRPPGVHEEAADAARPGVEVLVRAPDGEVDVPVVQRERDVADRVREVPAAHAALRRRV